MRGFFGLLLVCWAGWVMAQEVVQVCHGYGCQNHDHVVFSEARLRAVGQRLSLATSPAHEREQLAAVVGDLYRWAGEQSVIRNDRGGNFADDGVEGRMDCIDHSSTTTRFLRLLQDRRYLRWHRVGEIEVRHGWIVFSVHYAAMIETVSDGDAPVERYVVDSWFVDNGEPAVILPLDAWKKGMGPNV